MFVIVIACGLYTLRRHSRHPHLARPDLLNSLPAISPPCPLGQLDHSVGPFGRCLSSPIASARFSDGLAGSVVVSVMAGWSYHPRRACVVVLCGETRRVRTRRGRDTAIVACGGMDSEVGEEMRARHRRRRMWRDRMGRGKGNAPVCRHKVS